MRSLPALPGRAILTALERREIAPNFVLAGLGPAIHASGLSVTKTWMRGSSPRKTTLTAYIHLSQILSSSSSAFASVRSGVPKPSVAQP
jgi:hypothetical protein